MSNCQIRIINVKSGEELNLSAPNLHFDQNGYLVDDSNEIVDNNNLIRIANLLINNEENRNVFLNTIKNIKQDNKKEIKLGEDEFDLPITTAGKIFGNEDIEINSNFRILDIRNTNFFGQNFGNSFVKTSHGDFIIMNSIDSRQRNKVRDFLIIEHKLNRPDRSKDIDVFLNSLKEDSAINEYLKYQQKNINEINKKIESLQKEIEKEKNEKKSDYQNRISKYEKDIVKYKKIIEYSSMSVEELILSYIKFPSEFNNNIRLSRIKNKIKTAVGFLSGKNVKEFHYTDSNANTLISSLQFNSEFGKYCSDISSVFSSLITIAENLVEKAKNDKEFSIKNEDKINQLLEFYEKFDQSKDLTNSKDLKNHIVEWAQAILDNINDENFALIKPQFIRYKNKNNKIKYYITFENQYQTIGERFEYIDWKQISLLQKESNYNGYNIYTDKDGFFYIDRHILTTKSYGKRYSSLEEAKAAIDQKNKYTPLYRDESIVLINSLEDRDVSWFPYKIQEGRVIKRKDLSSFDDDYFDFKYMNPQNYPQFFVNNPEYALDNFKESLRQEYGKEILQLKTAEDLYLFLAARLNNKNKKSTSDIINDIMNITKYQYYQVQDVGNGIRTSSKYGFNKYSDMYNNPISMYKSVVIPVTVDLKNFYKKGNVQNRFIEVIDNLKTIASQINAHFGSNLITVDSYENLKNIDGLSDLIDENTRGCFYNGKIYINSSTATSKDIFHEYTHLILGIIKAKDTDIYSQIVEKLTSSKYGQLLIYNMRQIDKYKFLSQTDIQEEAAAEIMGQYMTGHKVDDITGENAKSVLANMVKAANSIFSGKKANLDIANMKIADFFNFFISLSSIKQNEEQNDFLFKEAKENRIITNIIQKGIQAQAKFNSKEFKGWENISKIKIEENCE